MSYQFSDLHQDLLEAFCIIAQKIEAEGSIDHMHVQVTMTKYRGEALEIKYSVGHNSYDSNVHGNHLGHCVEEFLRRNGWDIANNTKLLT